MIIQLPMEGHKVAVLFRLPAGIWADSVYLVGDFNQWSTSTTPMRQGEQYWEASLILEAGKTYYYAYLVDGTDWRTDAPDSGPYLGLDPAPINLLPIPIERPRRRAAD